MIEQHNAMLHSRQTIGNPGKVLAPQLFLFGIIEGSVVGGDNLQFMALQATPQLLVIRYFAHRRCTDKFCTLKSGRGINVIVQVEILWTRFAPHRQSLIASRGDYMQGSGTTDM